MGFPASSSGGAAGGSLAGTYPNPSIAGTVQLGNTFDPSVFFTVPHPVEYSTAAQVFTANQCRAARIRVPQSGTISDFVVGIGASSGNIDACLSSFDGTNYTTLWSKGSTACPAANTVTSLGNPALAVTRGDLIWIVLAADNATASFPRATTAAGSGLVLPAGLISGRLAWSKLTSFPLPTVGNTIADAAVTALASVHYAGIKIT